MNHPLAGVYAAVVTPLKTDFSPDLESIPPLLDFLAQRGCHGVLLLGTTGEGPSFSPEERAGIMRTALKVQEMHSSFRLLAGTGTPSLSETVFLTRLAFDLGFNGVVVLPPYYFRKVTEGGLFAYFSEVIRRATPADGALIYYHFPSLSGIQISVEFLDRLRVAFPNQFIGIKDSSSEVENILELSKRFGSEFLTLVGTERLFQLGLENHASGCITAPANLISPELRRAWDVFEQGNDPTLIQENLTANRIVLEKYTPFPPILKALLEKKHGFPHWPVRPPLEDVKDTVVAKAVDELDHCVS